MPNDDTRKGLLRTVQKNPTDTDAILVLADYLDHNGEPVFAEFYRLNASLCSLNGKFFEDIRSKRTEIDQQIKEISLALSPTDQVINPFSYDWHEAFSYAGEPDCCGSASVKSAAPHIEVSEEPFDRFDIEEVIALREGENDEKNWVCVGRLEDSRWFALDAGCDYTGWD